MSAAATPTRPDAPQCQPDEAMAFLRDFRAAGPWHLAGKKQDGGFFGRSFTAEQREEMRAWIVRLNAGRNNIYFMPNPAKTMLAKKASKADIRGVEWFYVDVDPIDGRSLPEERARIEALVQNFVPKPTIIIFTGGGCQALWKLDQEHALHDDGSNIKASESVNKALRDLLGGDDVQNVDRVLRLPGTVNWPDEQKRDKGRVPALAALVEADWYRTYPLSAFTHFQSRNDGKATAQPATLINADNILEHVPLESLTTVDARTKMIIVQGRDIESPKLKDDSRSAWLFDAVCQLVRAQCTDETMMSIMLDPNYKISESVRDKSNPHGYAAKQISSAREKVAHELQPQRHFEFTDMGNTYRYVAQHGQDVLYIYPWKSYLVWDGRRFRIDDSGAAMRNAKATVDTIWDEVKALANNSDAQKSASAWALKSQQRPRLDAILALAQCEVPALPDDFDKDDALLNLENGTLDLRTLTLREHRREDRITKLAPVHLDPNATCPNWLGFLERIYDADRDLISFVQRAVGYSLTGSTGEQVFFLLHGKGANGKSTLLEVLRGLFGEYGRPTEFRTLLDRGNSDAIRNDLAALWGLRFVTAIEVGKGKHFDEAVVKQLTGGDTITARFLHKEFFDFRPKFKLWLAANDKPVIQGTDEAIWRRVHLIPHAVTIPEHERDAELPAKLSEELPGILNWALEGLRAYRRDGLQPPQKVLVATKGYRREMDLIADFLETRCVVGETFSIRAGELYNAYVRHCEDAGEEPLSKRAFGQRLDERGFSGSYRKNMRFRHGLDLRGGETAMTHDSQTQNGADFRAEEAPPSDEQQDWYELNLGGAATVEPKKTQDDAKETTTTDKPEDRFV